MKHNCPTCGQQTSLSGRERTILEAVARREDGITTDGIVDHLFADDPNGGPLGARGVVHVAICSANRKLSHYGVRIQGENCGGNSRELGRYRLVTI